MYIVRMLVVLRHKYSDSLMCAVFSHHVLCSLIVSCALSSCSVFSHCVLCSLIASCVLSCSVFSRHVLHSFIMSCILSLCSVFSCPVLCSLIVSCVLSPCPVSLYPVFFNHVVDLSLYPAFSHQSVRCPAGSSANASVTGCELCPVGQFQPLPNQLSCLSCATNFTTAQPGSTSDSACQRECHSFVCIIMSLTDCCIFCVCILVVGVSGVMPGVYRGCLCFLQASADVG